MKTLKIVFLVLAVLGVVVFIFSGFQGLYLAEALGCVFMMLFCEWANCLEQDIKKQTELLQEIRDAVKGKKE